MTETSQLCREVLYRFLQLLTRIALFLTASSHRHYQHVDWHFQRRKVLVGTQGLSVEIPEELVAL